MRLFTSAQVAEKLGISQRRVQALAKDGRAGFKIGREYMFNVRCIEKLRVRVNGRPKKS